MASPYECGSAGIRWELRSRGDVNRLSESNWLGDVASDKE
jgi:hypothetical protein